MVDCDYVSGLSVRHMDVLNTDWPGLAAEKGGCLNVIGNLPYYIVSQVLFSLADSHRSVDTAVLTMQLEVNFLLFLLCDNCCYDCYYCCCCCYYYY